MNTNMLLGLGLLGALGIGAWLLFSNQGSGGFSFGDGGGSGGSGAGTKKEGSTDSGGSFAGLFGNVTGQPMSITVKKTGSNINTFMNVQPSNRVGLITVGSPVQQIEQFNIAPRILGGKKVM